ncbi:uncharacterized protein SPPG_04816 [Spizellomyces punctatus DAOM BR117]|uniref:Extracellular membrane protein CFEM domain-containing protein n=1 Tax=Spizellomyces punctatus (strain DAOM BR117) TaxID=645134 RepID=A0A0L0HG74_SPIPD|nr:uncharacterized protein SPPG_04816 [Spizellomyces punctatus DAOM BR117]KND00501.1 hypothetical protein SPPG_04816 [Spizellomyces punctatus DAOM BR117]|eukprot:XP_016608540.1 hypothetical protein SPPG_04816 [Spizellomyces punctatus DAOM BR117]
MKLFTAALFFGFLAAPLSIAQPSPSPSSAAPNTSSSVLPSPSTTTSILPRPTNVNGTAPPAGNVTIPAAGNCDFQRRTTCFNGATADSLCAQKTQLTTVANCLRQIPGCELEATQIAGAAALPATTCVQMTQKVISAESPAARNTTNPLPPSPTSNPFANPSTVKPADSKTNSGDTVRSTLSIIGGAAIMGAAVLL